MSVDFIRELCLSHPNATEELQWGDHLLFKIGGKMFAITSLGPEGVRLSLKSTEEKFYELTEIDGVIPAPYMARNFWISLERWDALRPSDIEELVRESYTLVLAKLPKRKQAELSAPTSAKKAAAKKAAPARKSKAKKK